MRHAPFASRSYPGRRGCGVSSQLSTRSRACSSPQGSARLDAVRATLASGAFDLVAWIQAAEALATAEVDASRTRGELAVARVALDRAVGVTTEEALRDE